MNPLALFGISILASFVSSAVAAWTLVWPRLQREEPNRALTALVAPHMFLRFIGLSFLVPGVVSPLLPAGFAIPAAYGDFIAGILAIVATVGLANHTAWANRLVWLFNIWGAADLLFAFYQGRHVAIHPGMLGAGFYLVTALVPPLLVTHLLIFGLLLRRRAAGGPDRSQRPQYFEVRGRMVR